MTKNEFAIIADAIRTYYPKENILPNAQAMELWFMELQDIPFDVAQTSIRQWVSINKWSPTIADIREMASTVSIGAIPEWGEGWEQVLKAIRQFGMYRVGEAMDSFDSITRQCVERLGFRDICLSENINADRANFRMMYESLQERKKKEAQTPAAVMALIESIRNNNVKMLGKD